MRAIFTNLVFLISVCINFCYGQTASPPPTPQSNSATTGTGSSSAATTSWDISSGYLSNLSGEHTSESYYSVKYQGQQIAGSGSPVTGITGTGATDVPSAANQDSILSLDLSRDSTSGGGELFDLLKGLPLKNSGFNPLKDYSGSVVIAGTASQSPSHIDVDVGVEHDPWYPLLGLNKHSSLSITNWVILGLQGGTLAGKNTNASTGTGSTNPTDQTAENDELLFTYRSFFGTYIGKPQLSQSEKALRQQILTDAPKLSNIGDLTEALDKSDTDTNTDKISKDSVFIAELQLADTVPAVTSTKVNSSPTFDLDGYAFIKEIALIGSQHKNELTEDPISNFANWPVNVQIAFEFSQAENDPKEYPGHYQEYKAAIDAYLQNQIYTETTDIAINVVVKGLIQEMLFAGSKYSMIDDQDIPSSIIASAEKGYTSGKPTDGGLSLKRAYVRIANRELLDSVFPDAFTDPTTGALWQDKLTLFESKYDVSPTETPVSLWFTDDGWATVAGKPVNGGINNLLGANLTYYFNPQAVNRIWITLQYQNGRNRSAPTEYQNFYALTTGISF
jgi:hypothetical protein